MQKWEYRTYTFMSGESLDGLNKLGQEGWELVSVTPASEDSYGIAYLKRPLAELPEEKRSPCFDLRCPFCRYEYQLIFPTGKLEVDLKSLVITCPFCDHEGPLSTFASIVTLSE